jgi:hypothetical protein
MDLLYLLNVATPEAAEDGAGAGAGDIVVALETAIEEDDLRQLVWGIGRLAMAAGQAVEIHKAPEQTEIDGADGLRTADAPTDAKPHLRLAVRGTLRRHGGDILLQAHVATLLDIYKTVMGKPAALTNSSDGRAPRLSGKCLDFVRVALLPLGATITPDQLDAMIETAKKKHRNKM